MGRFKFANSSHWRRSRIRASLNKRISLLLGSACRLYRKVTCVCGAASAHSCLLLLVYDFKRFPPNHQPYVREFVSLPNRCLFRYLAAAALAYHLALRYPAAGTPGGLRILTRFAFLLLLPLVLVFDSRESVGPGTRAQPVLPIPLPKFCSRHR